MQVLEGKVVSHKIQSEIEREISQWEDRGWARPHLTVILVGHDPASEIYVGRKQRMCQKLGFSSETVRLPSDVTQQFVRETLQKLNQNSKVDGILVQLPLPSHLDSREILEDIDPLKDVDCLTEKNLGRVLTNRTLVKPCTPSGIIEILDHYNIDIVGKRVAIVGRSLIVGTPLFHILSRADATVTLFHSKSRQIREQLHHFDVVCVAVGRRHLFKYSDFREGAVVIDVGMNRTQDGLSGDVENDAYVTKNPLRAATPVPGGVGVMTIAMLMRNTLTLAKLRRLRKGMP